MDLCGKVPILLYCVALFLFAILILIDDDSLNMLPHELKRNMDLS